MMRIRPISTSVTLVMMAIVLAAPLVANMVIGHWHVEAKAPQATQDKG